MLSNVMKIIRFQTRSISKSVRVFSGIKLNYSLQSFVDNKLSKKILSNNTCIQIRQYSNPLPPSNNLDEVLVDANTYEIVCNETLESLCDYFDELVESNPNLKDADIIYGVSYLHCDFINFQSKINSSRTVYSL